MTWLSWAALAVTIVLLVVAIIQAWQIRWELKLARMGVNGLMAAIEVVDEVNTLKVRLEILERREGIYRENTFTAKYTPDQ